MRENENTIENNIDKLFENSKLNRRLEVIIKQRQV